MKKVFKNILAVASCLAVFVFIAVSFTSCGKNGDGTTHVSTEKQLRKAVSKGEDITLDADIALGSPLEITAELDINLNGKTVSASFAAQANASAGERTMFYVNGGKLTIEGTGVVRDDSTGGLYLFYASAAGSEIDLKNGTFTSAKSPTLALVGGTASLDIEGGTFEITTLHPEFGSWLMFNKVAADFETCTISISGGKFKGYNPSEIPTNVFGTQQNFLEGTDYQVSTENGYYIVTEVAD